MIRNQAGRPWQLKLATYVVASTLTATAAGGALGWLGALLSDEFRVVLATLLAAVGIAYGVTQLLERSIPLCQLDRETSQTWLHRGPLAWAAMNGGALGLGFTSRIGFPLWYVVPATAVLAGSPLVGALVYGIYGFTRGAGAFLLMVAERGRNQVPVSDWVLGRRAAAQSAAAVYLVIVSVAVAVVAGA